LEILGYK